MESVLKKSNLQNNKISNSKNNKSFIILSELLNYIKNSIRDEKRITQAIIDERSENFIKELKKEIISEIKK
jgi:hypothetical protein